MKTLLSNGVTTNANRCSALFTAVAELYSLCLCTRTPPQSYYVKALLANGVTSALRLHQRVPNFQFSREYFGRLFLEDAAHYLFYSLIFVTGPPLSSILALCPL